MKAEIVIEQAFPEDIRSIAHIFMECFEKSVRHYCGKLPSTLAMEDIFHLVQTAESEGAFVAKRNGLVIGYCFAPLHLSNIWGKAITKGYIFKWIWRYLSGQYGLGIYPLKILLYNKVLFILSALSPAASADARILSIAVSKNSQGQGAAQLLMKAAMRYFENNKMTKVRLEVRPENMPAIAIYKKMGFVENGHTRDSQGEWLIMFKEMR